MVNIAGHKLGKSSWEEVTIKDFYALQKVKKDETNEIAELDFAISTYATLNEMSSEELYSLGINNLLKRLGTLNFLGEELPKRKLKRIVKVDGREFKVEVDLFKIKTLYFLDLQHYLNQPTNIHLILSILLIPVESYKDIYWKKVQYRELEYITREDIQEFLYENMSIVDAQSILSFFLKVWKRLINLYKVGLMKNQNKILRRMIWMRLKFWERDKSRREALGSGLNGLIELQKQLEEVGKMYMK